MIQPSAHVVLDMIGVLYGVERQAKKKPTGERLALRQEKSVPVMNAIFDWCRVHQAEYELPSDPLRGAIRYALKGETALRRYAADGRLEIDNNAAERILRLIAIGRKNWLFYGSIRGGRTGAILHSLLASAHRNGLNEFACMLDVLDRLCDLKSQAELFELLPDRWQWNTAR